MYISWANSSGILISTITSLGLIFVSSSKRVVLKLVNEVVLNSPVLISVEAKPILLPSSYMATRYVFKFSNVALVSTYVPGVIILITSLLTNPLAKAGSSTCSHIATLYPFEINLGIYVAAAWNGIPHIGALSSSPQSFPVKTNSKALDASFASSKNIS